MIETNAGLCYFYLNRHEINRNFHTKEDRLTNSKPVIDDY